MLPRERAASTATPGIAPDQTCSLGLSLTTLHARMTEFLVETSSVIRF